MEFEKSEGTTKSERYLSKLCNHTFLSMWSFSNLYTDEGRKNNKGDGKELCDLLVVFGNDVIIFSDKDIKFCDNKPTEIAWRRWFDKAVLKSVKQIYGAEKWIINNSNRIFLDSKCENKFPQSIPNSNSIRIHRIAVSIGSYEACRKHFGYNSLGSLIIRNDIEGKEHYNHPFSVGNIDRRKGFIHIFDELALDTVLRELDTISDFLSYLYKREYLLKKKKPILVSPGNEQLLSIYLTNMNRKGEHDFVLPTKNHDFIQLGEDFWDNIINNPQYINKKKADKISYYWDDLIERTSNQGYSPSYPKDTKKHYPEKEFIVRLMASEDRLRRRLLSTDLLRILNTTPKGKNHARITTSNKEYERTYIFLVVSKNDGENTLQYRTRRREMLCCYCMVTKLKAPKAKFIIGIAIDNKSSEQPSEDFVILDSSAWTQELNKEALYIQKEYNIFNNPNTKQKEGTIHEYPIIQRNKKKKVCSEIKRKKRKMKRNLKRRKSK